MLSLLTASLLALVPAIQEPPAPAETATEASQEPETNDKPAGRRSRRKPQLAPNEPDAVAFLGKLVDAQQIEPELPAVTAFRMEFQLRDYHPDRGMNELDVRVDFRSADAAPQDAVPGAEVEPLGFEEIRLRANDPQFNEMVSKGLDAEGYWLRDEEGQLLTLEAKEYANDRKTIDQTLTFCEDFLLLFDLDQLRKRAGGLSLSSTEEAQVLAGEMVRSREVWKFRLVVPKGATLPEQLILELPESARQAANEAEQAESDSEATPLAAGPAILNYYFYDWSPHAGRLLPIGIDEFHEVEVVDETPIRRAIDVRRFLWRVNGEIHTSRGPVKATGSAQEEPPAESRD